MECLRFSWFSLIVGTKEKKNGGWESVSVNGQMEAGSPMGTYAMFFHQLAETPIELAVKVIQCKTQ
jgi:hypothetical protein